MVQNEELLRVSGLCRYFGKGKKLLRAVDGVSFSVRRGEVFGLVGESGCGKTTVGRTVIGLYPPTGGEIYFDGQLVASKGKSGRSLGEREINRRIQMIFQDPVASLDPRMTVGEIISEGLVIGGVRDKDEVKKEVSRMLDLVGLRQEYAGRYPHEFSGGQRQRIGIARALIMNPELIIADEPVSALDVSVQAQIINLLNDLREEFGTAILFVAHDLAVVKHFSDRIGVMYFGRIVETAESDELFRHPLHPYTKSLLSAIPHPDPVYEKSRQRIIYEPADDGKERELHEVAKGHLVMCTEAEAEVYMHEIKG